MDWIKMLSSVSKQAIVKPDTAFMYGLFIQRLGFTSGGYPQDIRLYDISSGKLVRFRVKPTFKSSKKNIFCYEIPPGKYKVVQYWWTQSTWYGGKIFTEQIIKNSDHITVQEYAEGQIAQNPDAYYTFSVEPGTLNYLGTWHFDTQQVHFSDDKQELDKKLAHRFKKLYFDAATTVIPA